MKKKLREISNMSQHGFSKVSELIKIKFNKIT